MKKLFAMFMVLVSSIVLAQTGTIEGVVLDGENGNAPIVGAKLGVVGLPKGAYSQAEGKFVIKLVPAGTYSIKAAYALKAYNKTIDSIVVKPGEVTHVEVVLGVVAVKTQMVQLDLSQFVVKEEVAVTQAAAIEEVKNESKVVNMVTIEETKKKGDATVAASVRRVSGVSVQSGGYANIRGLNDRYIKTTLNGSEIPGLDPRVNSVQLDLFPTSFLSNIKVVKTFTPDLPGDFTGGLIDIKTANAPDSFVVNVSAGTTYNPTMHFNKNYITYQGGKYDFLAIQDGTRDLPSILKDGVDNKTFVNPADVYSGTSAQNTANQQINSMDYSRNQNQSYTKTSPLDFNFNITVGNTVKWKAKNRKDTMDKKSLGYFVGGQYRRSFFFVDQDNGVRSTYIQNGVLTKGGLSVDELKSYQESRSEALLGSIAGFKYTPNKFSNIWFMSMHTRSATKRTLVADGTTNDDPTAFERIQQFDYIQRSMTTNQLLGEHKLDTLGKAKNPMVLDWVTGFTFSNQYQPDFRNYEDQYRIVNGVRKYEFNYGAHGRPARFWRFTDEYNSDVKVNLTMPIALNDSTEMKIKTGLSHTYKMRDFSEYRFDYLDLKNQAHNGVFSDYFSSEKLGYQNGQAGILLSNGASLRNQYTGSQQIMGLYVMTELPLGKKWDFVGGVRGEYADIYVETKDKFIKPGELKTITPLPSVNFIYTLFEDKEKRSVVDTTKKDKQKFREEMKSVKELLVFGTQKEEWINCYLESCEVNYASYYHANQDEKGVEKLANKCTEGFLSSK